MEDINLINETFNLYYSKAKDCLAKGDKLLAKRYYMLAAEQMLKMAKSSEGELQKARFMRAKSILEFADGIDVPQKKKSNSDTSDDSSNIVVKNNEKISLEEALNQLNSLVGLSRVKQQVLDWIDQINVFKLRKERGLKTPDMSYHLVFTGNPGTGKTTVARLMAQIYCALGILSEGQLVEVDRSDLVAGYVGQTAIKTREALKKAYGGVLFIDEAYSLAKEGGTDFGQEAIDTVLKEMEDKRSDLVVIVAGYENLMNNFIESNPGLKSRFKTYMSFDDYSGDELYKIFVGLCLKNQYYLTDAAKSKLLAYFTAVYAKRDKNFGNGRDVRNLFENTVTRQSKRVARLEVPSDKEIATIDAEDIPVTVDLDNPPKTDSFSGNNDNNNCEFNSNNSFTNNNTNKNNNSSKGGSDLFNKNSNCDGSSPEDKFIGGDNSEFKFDWDSLPSIKFTDIAGLENVKEVVRVKVLLPLMHPEFFEGYVKKSGGGVLLYGPPGTGKTMIAAAIANEIGAKFCSVKPSDLLHQGAGNTEKAVRALFAQARNFPCAVIYFDEMDSISPKSTKSQYARQLRSEFLAQLQGIDEYKGDKKNILFLIAATNKPWDIDSAFLRPGRFGTKIYVGLPDADARNYMITHRFQGLSGKGVVKIADDINVQAITEQTEGFNGSDMSNLLDRVEEISALRAITLGEKYICAQDFSTALEQVSSSVQRADIEKLAEWRSEND